MWNSSSGSARGIPHFQMKTICRQGEKPINPHVVILSLPASGCRPKTSLILTTNRNFIVYHLFDGVLRFDCVYRFNNPSPTFIKPLPPLAPPSGASRWKPFLMLRFYAVGLKTAWRRLGGPSGMDWSDIPVGFSSRSRGHAAPLLNCISISPRSCCSRQITTSSSFSFSSGFCPIPSSINLD